MAFADIPAGVLDNLELRDIGGTDGGLALSPDGRYAAFVERETRLESDDCRHTLVVLDLHTLTAVRLADAGGFIHHTSASGRRQGAARLRRPVWSPDGRHIAFLFGASSGEIYLDVAELQTQSTRRVISGPGDVYRFAWRDDATLLAEMGRDRIAIEEAAMRARRDGFLLDAHLEPLMGLLPEHDPRDGAHLVSIDVTTGVARDVSQPAPELTGHFADTPSRASLRQATGPSSDTAFIRTRPAAGSGGTSELVYRASDGRELVCALTECQGEISGPWIDDRGLYFQRIEAPTRTTTSIYEWRPHTNTLRLVRSAEDLIIECGLARSDLICLREATLEPRRLVAISLRSGAMRTLYEPNPEWGRQTMPRVTRLDAADAFGNPTFAHLIYPVGYDRRRTYPMVIVQYRSRMFLRGGVGGEIPIHALARRGCFVLSFERPQHVADRTVQNNQAALIQEELEGIERRSKLSALYALVDMALATASIDRNRIGLTGLSDGAETAYWALADSNRFAAAVISSPPLDPMTYSLVSEDFTNSARSLRDRRGPWPDTEDPWAAHWRDKPAVNHVTEIETPILLQLADREALPAFPFFRRMREHDRAIEMYLYPDAYHVKSRPRQLLAAQLRALAWLDFWLRDEELADPHDPDRFARWRSLRERVSGMD